MRVTILSKKAYARSQRPRPTRYTTGAYKQRRAIRKYKKSLSAYEERLKKYKLSKEAYEAKVSAWKEKYKPWLAKKRGVSVFQPKRKLPERTVKKAFKEYKKAGVGIEKEFVGLKEEAKEVGVEREALEVERKAIPPVRTYTSYTIPGQTVYTTGLLGKKYYEGKEGKLTGVGDPFMSMDRPPTSQEKLEFAGLKYSEKAYAKSVQFKKSEMPIRTLTLAEPPSFVQKGYAKIQQLERQPPSLIKTAALTGYGVASYGYGFGKTTYEIAKTFTPKGAVEFGKGVHALATSPEARRELGTYYATKAKTKPLEMLGEAHAFIAFPKIVKGIAKKVPIKVVKKYDVYTPKKAFAPLKKVSKTRQKAGVHLEPRQVILKESRTLQIGAIKKPLKPRFLEFTPTTRVIVKPAPSGRIILTGQTKVKAMKVKGVKPIKYRPQIQEYKLTGIGKQTKVGYQLGVEAIKTRKGMPIRKGQALDIQMISKGKIDYGYTIKHPSGKIVKYERPKVEFFDVYGRGAKVKFKVGAKRGFYETHYKPIKVGKFGKTQFSKLAVEFPAKEVRLEGGFKVISKKGKPVKRFEIGKFKEKIYSPALRKEIIVSRPRVRPITSLQQIYPKPKVSKAFVPSTKAGIGRQLAITKATEVKGILMKPKAIPKGISILPLKTRVITKVKPKAKLKSVLRPETRTRIKTRVRTRVRTKPVVRTRIQIKPIVRTRIKTRLRTRVRTRLRTRVRTKPVVRTRIQIKPIISPKILPLRISLKKKKKGLIIKKLKKDTKLPARYTPSLIAIGKQIYTTKPVTPRTTGLPIRPIKIRKR